MPSVQKSLPSKSPQATTRMPILEAKDAQQEPLTNCDGVGTFTCPTGTCYTGLDGFIGCCSVSSCAARTTCLSYNPTRTSSCDPNTGGCVVCHSANPACRTTTNDLEDQYIMYCDLTAGVVTVSYLNNVTTGSTASPPSVLPSASPSATAGSPIAVQIPTSTTPGISSTQSSSFSPPSNVSSSSTSSPRHKASSSPSPAPSAKGALKKGTIAGTAIGSFLFILITLIALYFCIRHARKKRSRNISRVPRVTLGGATLPGERNWTNDKDDTENKPQEETAMLKDCESSPKSPIAGPTPWSPNNITSAPRTSRELDSQPFLPLQTPPEAPIPSNLGLKPGPPTNRHALESGLSKPELHARTQSQIPVTPTLNPTSSSRHLSQQSSHLPELSKSSSENSLSPNLPGGASRFSGNTQLTEPISESSWLDPNQRHSPVSSVGRKGSRENSGMSATGSWRGYMSPETALAGGWKDDDRDGDDGGEK